MRAIREAMAGTESVQGRLDAFVTAISAAMQVKVASVYLLRKGDELELSATEGLKKSAVHKTRLKPGEGLVGHVSLTARPLNLADAPSHPLFSYRPETAEDPFRSFLGVPILRGSRVLGVLVVQSEDARSFNEEEVEDLLTVAMVIGDPGSRLRSLYDLREKALMRLQAARAKLAEAEARLDRKRAVRVRLLLARP